MHGLLNSSKSEALSSDLRVRRQKFKVIKQLRKSCSGEGHGSEGLEQIVRHECKLLGLLSV